MYCITDQHIDYILNDIRRNGIETEDLQLNLLDHICCLAEQQLKEEDDFERFYQETIKQFYHKELREIEEETILLLTFKNYNMMKKIMTGSGAISVFAFLAGSVFKVMHWPGAGILLTLGLLTTSFFFLPMVFILKAKEVNTGLEKLTVATGTLLGILCCLDFLFTVNHWPGATILWIVTICFSFFIFIPLYFFTGIRKPETRTNTMLTSIMLVGFTGLLFMLVNLRPSPGLNETNLSSYLRNEMIWQNMEQTPPFKNASEQADISSIIRISGQLKGAILEYATGKAALPSKAAAGKLDFRQEQLSYMDGYFKAQGEGSKLLQQLQAAIKEYNLHRGSTGNTILMTGTLFNEPAELILSYDNLYVLNSLTQLQIYLATTSIGNMPQAVAQR